MSQVDQRKRTQKTEATGGNILQRQTSLGNRAKKRKKKSFTFILFVYFQSPLLLAHKYKHNFLFLQVTMIYQDPTDSSFHSITLKTVAEGGDFDPTSLYDPNANRLGWVSRRCEGLRDGWIGYEWEDEGRDVIFLDHGHVQHPPSIRTQEEQGRMS